MLGVSNVGGLGNSESVELSKYVVVISDTTENDGSVRLTAGAGDNDITVATEETSDSLDPCEEEESCSGKNIRLIYTYEGTSSGILSGAPSGHVYHSVSIDICTHCGTNSSDDKEENEINKCYSAANYEVRKRLKESLNESYVLDCRYIYDLEEVVSEQKHPRPKAE